MYQVRIASQDSTIGDYEVRVELARGLQLESDADYRNDTIAQADVLALARGVTNHAVGKVAGTVMGSEGSNANKDVYALGINIM